MARTRSACGERPMSSGRCGGSSMTAPGLQAAGDRHAPAAHRFRGRPRAPGRWCCPPAAAAPSAGCRRAPRLASTNSGRAGCRPRAAGGGHQLRERGGRERAAQLAVKSLASSPISTRTARSFRGWGQGGQSDGGAREPGWPVRAFRPNPAGRRPRSWAEKCSTTGFHVQGLGAGEVQRGAGNAVAGPRTRVPRAVATLAGSLLPAAETARTRATTASWLASPRHARHLAKAMSPVRFLASFVLGQDPQAGEERRHGPARRHPGCSAAASPRIGADGEQPPGGGAAGLGRAEAKTRGWWPRRQHERNGDIGRLQGLDHGASRCGLPETSTASAGLATGARPGAAVGLGGFRHRRCGGQHRQPGPPRPRSRLEGDAAWRRPRIPGRRRRRR